MSVVDDLRIRIQELVRPHVTPRERVAFVHFPSHRNPGDAAISTGALRLLRELGADIRYISTRETYDPTRLAGAVGNGAIFLNGGGSFGDHYAWEQAFRERVLLDFPTHRIVQLPQTLNFTSDTALKQARQSMDHPHLTLFLRDDSSYTVASDVFSAPTVLCPDLAFACKPVRRSRPSADDILCLARSDSESTGQIYRLAGRDLLRTDWPYSPIDAVRWPIRRALAWAGRREREPSDQWWIEQIAYRALPALAQATLAAASRFLCRYRVVITDRLHGHILCVLLGIPNVILDDRNGKVRSFYDTWTSSSELVHFASTADDALELARSFQ